MAVEQCWLIYLFSAAAHITCTCPACLNKRRPIRVCPALTPPVVFSPSISLLLFILYSLVPTQPRASFSTAPVQNNMMGSLYNKPHAAIIKIHTVNQFFIIINILTMRIVETIIIRMFYTCVFYVILICNLRYNKVMREESSNWAREHDLYWRHESTKRASVRELQKRRSLYARLQNNFC